MYVTIGCYYYYKLHHTLFSKLVYLYTDWDKARHSLLRHDKLWYFRERFFKVLPNEIVTRRGAKPLAMKKHFIRPVNEIGVLTQIGFYFIFRMS